MARLIGAQRMVLQAILDAQGEAQNYIEDFQITQSTRIALKEVRDWLETLEGEGYVEVARTEFGLITSITAKGRLALEQFRPFQSGLGAAGRTDQAPVFDRGQDGGDLSRPFGQVPHPGEDRKSQATTMMNIEDEIRTVLRPLMDDKDGRKARLDRAFATYPALLDRIDVHGETAVFLPQLLKTLRAFGAVERGRPAACVLLESIKGEVGVQDRERIERIVRDYPH